jgi:hypothetical protein
MARRLVLALLLVVACKDSAKQRAQQAVSGKDFWPDAPKPTSTTGTRTLRYQPANLKHYVLSATGGTPGSSQIAMDFKFTLDMNLTPGATPTERNANVVVLDLDMRAPQQKMKMRIDDKGMFLDDGKEQQNWTRAEPGPFDVVAMVERPFATLSFDGGQRMQSRAIDDHPFTALQMGDMLDDVLVLFPELPADAIAPGHRWKTTRNTPVGATGGRVDVTYEMTYVGDGACPSGAKTCSLINMLASSKDVSVMSEGRQMNVSYGFAGKIYFDYERGVLDESRVNMNMDAKVSGIDMTITALYVVKP